MCVLLRAKRSSLVWPEPSGLFHRSVRRHGGRFHLLGTENGAAEPGHGELLPGHLRPGLWGTWQGWRGRSSGGSVPALLGSCSRCPVPAPSPPGTELSCKHGPHPLAGPAPLTRETSPSQSGTIVYEVTLPVTPGGDLEPAGAPGSPCVCVCPEDDHTPNQTCSHVCTGLTSPSTPTPPAAC